MDKEEIDSKIILNKLRNQQDLMDEFESLRPNWKGTVISIVSTLGSLALVMWLFPEILEQPVLYVLLIISLSAGYGVQAESKKINRRIDVLYRLLKNDV